MPQNERKPSFSAGPLAVFASFLLLQLFGLFGENIGVRGLLFRGLVILIAFLAPILLFSGMQTGRTDKLFPMGHLTKPMWGLVFAAFFMLVFAEAFLSFVVLGHSYEGDAITLYGTTISAGKELWQGVLTFLIMVLPAVAEEFLLRGLVFDAYRYAGVTGTVLLCALFSGVLGASFQSFLPLFLAGMCFALVRFVTGRLTPAIACHILWALYQLYLRRFLWRMSISPVSRVLFACLMVLFFGLFLLLFLHLAEKLLRTRKEEAPFRLPKQKRAEVLLDVVGAPMLLILLGGYLLVSVLRLLLG